MNFTSAVFLFIFLPITIFSYYIIPVKYRNIWLCITSLIFYSWSGLAYAILIIGLTIINYFISLMLRNKVKSKLLFIISLCLNISVLVVFKYFNFFIDNINVILRACLPGFTIGAPKIPLPIGISFFTFKIISYLIDTYKGEIIPEKNFINLATYILIFPEMLAGPIDRYKNIKNQLVYKKFDWERIHSGLSRFIIGLGKKVIIANTMCGVANYAFDNLKDLNMIISWIGILGYTLQIYFDFSGYSDMAIGIGKMLGFDFVENFNYPYISKSIQEFWRRWHISLSSWFKDYVYIPLGGNRKGISRTYVNLLIVFLLTGLWHGAAWNFIIWGLYYGIFLVIERMGFNKLLKKIPGFFSHLYTLLVVMIGWVLFRANNINDAIFYLSKMFSFSTKGWEKALLMVDEKVVLFICLAIIFSAPIAVKMKELIIDKNKNNLYFAVTTELGLIILYFVSLAFISGSSFNPFIYFRF